MLEHAHIIDPADLIDPWADVSRPFFERLALRRKHMKEQGLTATALLELAAEQDEIIHVAGSKAVSPKRPDLAGPQSPHEG